ncbi:hypothetical protein B0J14DRAFT_106648 [Halenospora varia]|nr:hypothetical protein B0J14DRAFT_106648 [Halenospora varia]
MDLVEPPAMACSLNSSPSKILATSITHKTKARNMHHVPHEDTPPFEQAYTMVGSPRTRLSTRMTCMRQTPNFKKKTRASLLRPLKFLQSWRIPDEARHSRSLERSSKKRTNSKNALPGHPEHVETKQRPHKPPHPEYIEGVTTLGRQSMNIPRVFKSGLKSALDGPVPMEKRNPPTQGGKTPLSASGR